MVIRGLAPHVYLLAPVGSSDEYWQHHLGDKPQVKGRLMKHVKEKVPEGIELIRRWQLVGTSKRPPSREDLSFLGTKGAEASLRRYEFFLDVVVADTEEAQDGQSSEPSYKNGL